MVAEPPEALPTIVAGPRFSKFHRIRAIFLAALCCAQPSSKAAFRWALRQSLVIFGNEAQLTMYNGGHGRETLNLSESGIGRDECESCHMCHPPSVKTMSLRKCIAVCCGTCLGLEMIRPVMLPGRAQRHLWDWHMGWCGGIFTLALSGSWLIKFSQICT